MILTEKVEIKLNNKSKKYYIDKGYDINSKTKTIMVDVKDLTPYSKVKIMVRCDICEQDRKDEISYENYYKSFKKHNIYACCKKCAVENTKRTNIEKYGYGNVFQNEDIKKKIVETNNEKYGVDYVQQNKNILDKSKKTNLERYGCERPSQNKEIYQKMSDTMIERYGDSIPLRNKEIYQKMLNTVQDKYGVDNVGQREEHKTILNKYTFDKYKKNLKEEDIDLISYNDYVFKCYDNKCNHEYEIISNSFYNRKHYRTKLCPICNPFNSNESGGEKEIKEFITSLDIEFEDNDRTVLEGKELDIYIPNYNLAIEHNGVYWHSEAKKPNNYHTEKTNSCNEKGVQLMHIFEDDWKYKQNICKSIIRNKLGKTTEKIYARKCEIKEVKSNIAREFLNENHIQGFSKSTYKLGLYYNDKLVSLMTFGYRKINKNKEFELIRFCNKIDTNIIGASSKLFKYFINNYTIETDYILSYADPSLFDGQMYNSLGFKYISRSEPSYYWVIDGIREHRWKYAKHKLVAEGYDNDMSESEIMHMRGFFRIYGVGQDRYEYFL